MDNLSPQGLTALPGFTAGKAAALAATWDDGGLWEDVRWLARRCWHDQQEEFAALSWHHLVLAVGNFKRQTGRRLRPCQISSLPSSSIAPSKEFVLTSGLAIDRDSEASWRQLEEALPGAALATTTTLLAALWPDDHFIFDWRVQAAADGIRIHAKLPATPKTQREIDTRKWQRPDFDDYEIVRRWLKTVDCPLRTSERALYRLSQSVPTVRGRSWAVYGEAVANILDGVQRSSG